MFGNDIYFHRLKDVLDRVERNPTLQSTLHHGPEWVTYLLNNYFMVLSICFIYYLHLFVRVCFKN